MILSRVGPVIVAAVASALLVAGPAFAADGGPPVGTPDCEQKVNDDPAVQGADRGSAEALSAAKADAESRLCSPASSGTSTTTTTTTSSSPTKSSSASKPPGPSPRPGPSGPPASHGSHGGGPGHGAAPRHPDRPGDRDCADFATQQDAQRYFESIGGSSTNDADRLDENHNGVACESLSDDGDNQDAAVTATGDDGSEATTSGKQVTEVPEGSAQTGGK